MLRKFIIFVKTNKYYLIFPISFSLLITNKPLKVIIIAPIIILNVGISPSMRYPKIIPNIMTLYLADAVNDRGA